MTFLKISSISQYQKIVSLNSKLYNNKNQFQKNVIHLLLTVHETSDPSSEASGVMQLYRNSIGLLKRDDTGFV